MTPDLDDITFLACLNAVQAMRLRIQGDEVLIRTVQGLRRGVRCG